jgi:hypothetical protein
MKNDPEEKLRTREEIEIDLVSELNQLHQSIIKQNSFKHTFLTGMVKGIGYAVGATILFGLLLTIIGYIVKTSDTSWVQQLADWAQLGESITI